jgi:hypothetical protein
LFFSTAAPIASTGWSDSIPGWAFHPAVDQRFSRRTAIAWIATVDLGPQQQRAASIGNANRLTVAALFVVVLNSKTSRSKLRFHFAASESMDITTPFEMVTETQEFPVPKETAKSGRSVDNVVARVGKSGEE